MQEMSWKQDPWTKESGSRPAAVPLDTGKAASRSLVEIKIPHFNLPEPARDKPMCYRMPTSRVSSYILLQIPSHLLLHWPGDCGQHPPHTGASRAEAPKLGVLTVSAFPVLTH